MAVEHWVSRITVAMIAVFLAWRRNDGNVYGHKEAIRSVGHRCPIWGGGGLFI